MEDVIVILWTCADEEEAKTIIHKLLKKGWIACANIVPKVTSIYTWKEKIEESEEVLIFLKSTAENFSVISHFIQDECSYDTPEILQIHIDDGAKDYMKWVRRCTQQ